MSHYINDQRIKESKNQRPNSDSDQTLQMSNVNKIRMSHGDSLD